MLKHLKSWRSKLQVKYQSLINNLFAPIKVMLLNKLNYSGDLKSRLVWIRKVKKGWVSYGTDFE